MTDNLNRRPESDRHGDFAALAARARPGLLLELWHFLTVTKKWWLAPVLVALILVGALIMVSGTAAAPFIYTLF